jgi:O-antigen/teichoic acid export membrane protein
MSKSSGSGLAIGAAWMIAMRWAARLVGLASTVVIARLLTPDDFGVVAVALIVVGLLETIAYLGVDLSLIKDQDAAREDFDSAWTVQLAQGFLIAAALIASASFVASYFKEPRATAVIAALALRPIIDGLQNIGIVYFRKDLDFAREFRFNLIAKLLGASIQIGAAWLLRSYWALVAGMLAASVVSTLLSYLLHPYRPRLTWSRAAKVWSFSQWLLVSRVGAFLGKRSDEFIVGRLAGTAAMGSYHVVYELATMPTSEIIMPMRRALFPALAARVNDVLAYRGTVLAALASSVTVCFGLGLGLSGTADLVVPLVLGPQWLSAIPILRWLALFGMLAAVTSVLEVPLWVAGRTDLSALLCWLELALAVPLILWAASRHGAEGAAFARVITSAMMLPIAAFTTRRACAISMRRQAATLLRPALAGMAMAAAMAAVRVPPAASIVPMLLLKLAVGAAVYCTTLWVAWRVADRPPGIEASTLQTLARLLRRRRT